MNIKSLLLGSAAALAAVSGAQAADAVVAAEPEPLEYVRVCDAFGTGYFYIPGTETCLKIGGYVRVQLDWDSADDVGEDDNWNARTRGYVNFETKSDTELGALGSFIALRTWAEGDYDGGRVEIDEAYIRLGGFYVGYKYTTFGDLGLSGETDDLGTNRTNTIGYEYAGEGFKANVSLDELTSLNVENDFGANVPTTISYAGNGNLGLQGTIAGTFSALTASLSGAYDFEAEAGAVKLIATANLGPGTLGISGLYASGASAYYDLGEWTIAAQYAAKITDKLTLTPGIQYWNTIDYDADGDWTGDRDAWRAGLTLDYKIVDGLATKVSVQYTDVDGQDEVWSGFVRLQRSF